MPSNYTVGGNLVGWQESGNDRGTIDIIWSSCVTIFLCCYVSTQPNVGASTDKWYHQVYDKLILACYNLVGPEFVFALALGEFSSARRSVRAFAGEEFKHVRKGRSWTYTHAYFLDMGGIHLTSPDYPEGFPINAEQLLYLVQHEYVDFPDMESMDIEGRDKVDVFTRLISIYQASLFFITEIRRASIGLPMTTLELTALSFSFVMIATSVVWFKKPSIAHPRTISTRNKATVHDIRKYAKQHTHPDLSIEWYRTPMDFISRRDFQIDVHCAYYLRLGYLCGFRLLTRPVVTRPWNRFPAERWLYHDPSWITIPAGLVLVGFSAIFLLGWSFDMPSRTELLLWRMSSVYHALFAAYGGFYYLSEIFKFRKTYMGQGAIQDKAVRQTTNSNSSETWYSKFWSVLPASVSSFVTRLRLGSKDKTRQESDTEAQHINDRSRSNSVNVIRRWVEHLACFRNISPDGDPAMTMQLRELVPVTFFSGLYVLCRLYMYTEDFASLRAQPAGVYITVNKYIPFLGS